MTLTETASLTKKLFVVFAIFVFLSISGWIGYQYYYNNYYLPSLPPVEIKPEVKFGVLPQPKFPPSRVSSSNFSYSLDTETGAVPDNLPKLLNVYFVPQLGTTLLASDKARALAANFNFTTGPDILTPTQYRFSDKSGGDMIVDLNTGNFNFNKNIATSSANTQTGFTDDPPRLTSDFKNFLSDKDLLKDQVINGRTNVNYDKSPQGGSGIAVVSIWQDNIDTYLVVTSDFKNGLIKAATANSPENTEKYKSLSYIYWPIDKTNFSNYPIKSAKVAFDELKDGLGIVVVEPKAPRVSLTSVYLAYFLSREYSSYVQPVYVFEGDNFVAYVAAITSDFLEKTAN